MCSQLDPLQRSALTAFTEGKSLAVLGGGGCGKSFLLQEILGHAREKIGSFPAITTCAPSNQAAARIKGRSVHSTFAAPPYWRWSKEGLWNVVSQKPAKCRALRDMQILVIDEVFLVTAAVLDSIDYVMRRLAPTDIASSLPFGGRQVILSGDPFQLPEIAQVPRDSAHSQNSLSSFDLEKSRDDGPVHASRSWFLTFGGFGSGTVVILDGNYRQAEDPQYYSILQRVRTGKALYHDIAKINGTSHGHRDVPPSHTQLCLLKSEVDCINLKALSHIDEVLHTCYAKDIFMTNVSNALLKRLEQAIPRKLSVKVGCAVLLLVGIAGMASGTQGFLQEVFLDPQTSCVSQISFSSEGNTIFLTPFMFSIRAGDTTILAQRQQFPILPAYAVTVHRCQGMTLKKVAMDFTKVRNWRPYGMVYVALSRCTSLEGIWVRSLTAEHIAVNPNALKLMEKVKLLNAHYPSRVISSTRDRNVLLEVDLNVSSTPSYYGRQMYFQAENNPLYGNKFR